MEKCEKHVEMMEKEADVEQEGGRSKNGRRTVGGGKKVAGKPKKKEKEYAQWCSRTVKRHSAYVGRSMRREILAVIA